MPILDFKEFSSSGTGAAEGETFEGLMRELGRALGLRPEWSGRGADQGRDLIFTETRRGVLGRQNMRWLVSCKDFATSGRSVNEGAVGSVSDKLRQHAAVGFLLATTTTASTGLKAMLDGLKSQGNVETLVWDRHEIEAILLQDSNLELVKRYLPVSYTAYRRLSSLPQALDSLEAIVPALVFDRLTSVLEAYQVGDTWLTGERIWPHDRASAETIDRALAALFEREAPHEAARELLDGEIEFDAFEATLRTLASVKPSQTQALCQHLVKAHNSDGTSLFAYRFFVDRFEPSNDDQITLATHLTSDDLHELFAEEVAIWIAESLVSDPTSFEAWSDLDALSSQTILEDAYPEDITFEAAEGFDKIRFKAATRMSVSLSYHHESAGSSSFPGIASGYIDAQGMYLEHVTVDTSSYFE